MSDATSAGPVERLFPFAMRARLLIVGREQLRRRRRRLQFLLVTRDLSERSLAEVLGDFAPCPVVRHYASADLERHFGLKGTKVLGFAKSSLARALYAGLRQYRINPPAG